MADHHVVCSMSRSGNVWDNAAMESFFSSLKTERTTRRIYRTRDDAKRTSCSIKHLTRCLRNRVQLRVLSREAVADPTPAAAFSRT
jgi:transposase InsO family protein